MMLLNLLFFSRLFVGNLPSHSLTLSLILFLRVAIITRALIARHSTEVTLGVLSPAIIIITG